MVASRKARGLGPQGAQPASQLLLSRGKTLALSSLVLRLFLCECE